MGKNMTIIEQTAPNNGIIFIREFMWQKGVYAYLIEGEINGGGIVITFVNVDVSVGSLEVC